MHLPRPSGLVTLLTDFGAADPYVGLVKGMVKRAYGRAEVIDLCHGVPPQEVAMAAFVLGAAVDHFPAGTVHVAVVDPGVGTGRRVLAACVEECYWLGPDNGVLSAVLDADPEVCEVRAVDLEQLRIEPSSATFHGRDVFAPVAGRLAGGRFGFRALGNRIDDPVRIPAITDGAPRVVMVDHFGNLVTNLAGGCSEVRIAGQTAAVHVTYGAAAKGALIAVTNSYGLIEVAEVGGSAAARLGVGVGTPVEPGGQA